MLILKRRRDERVILTTAEGTRIELLIIDVRDGAARLGFTAPADVVIHRSEIQERIDRGEGRPPWRERPIGEGGQR